MQHSRILIKAKISIFINKDGNLTTAAGSYKFDVSYFGR
jgi:hypothetical protein